jgi:hypothetical protein
MPAGPTPDISRLNLLRLSASSAGFMLVASPDKPGKFVLLKPGASLSLDQVERLLVQRQRGGGMTPGEVEAFLRRRRRT